MPQNRFRLVTLAGFLGATLLGGLATVAAAHPGHRDVIVLRGDSHGRYRYDDRLRERIRRDAHRARAQARAYAREARRDAHAYRNYARDLQRDLRNRIRHSLRNELRNDYRYYDRDGRADRIRYRLRGDGEVSL